MPTLQAKNRRKLGLKTLDERALADTLGPRKHERPRHHHIGENAVFIEQRRAEARVSAGDIGQAARNGEVEDSGVLHSHVRVLTEAIDQRIGVSASVAANPLTELIERRGYSCDVKCTQARVVQLESLLDRHLQQGD
jgi:hypothetical protein